MHIALLRGINLDGHKQVAMGDLRGILEELGFTGGRSLLQSGNLVFESSERTGTELEHLLEAETEGRLGLRTDYLVRNVEKWRSAIAQNTELMSKVVEIGFPEKRGGAPFQRNNHARRGETGGVCHDERIPDHQGGGRAG